MIRKVISGGQSGADQGGVKAAKLCGIEPGGTVPKGCLTEFGPMPELLELYNMVEHESDKYPPRTYENAKNSDGTIRFAVNWTTAGEKLTLKAINQYKKPYIDVDPRRPKPVADVVRWVLDHNIKVLNVAGNREKSWRGMEDFVVGYLKEVFTLLKGLERIPDASPFREFFGALRLFRNDHVWYINEDEEIFAEVNGEYTADVVVRRTMRHHPECCRDVHRSCPRPSVKGYEHFPIHSSNDERHLVQQGWSVIRPVKDVDYYIEDGRYVFTNLFLKKRGFCCKNGCRHCPYGYGPGKPDPPGKGVNKKEE